MLWLGRGLHAHPRPESRWPAPHPSVTAATDPLTEDEDGVTQLSRIFLILLILTASVPPATSLSLLLLSCSRHSEKFGGLHKRKQEKLKIKQKQVERVEQKLRAPPPQPRKR